MSTKIDAKVLEFQYRKSKAGKQFKIVSIETETGNTTVGISYAFKGELIPGKDYTLILDSINNNKYITGATEIIMPEAPPTKQGSSGQTFSREEGQSRGNYRTNLTHFVVSYLSAEKKLPSLDLIKEFNSRLSEGETDYFSEGEVSSEGNKNEDSCLP